MPRERDLLSFSSHYNTIFVIQSNISSDPSSFRQSDHIDKGVTIQWYHSHFETRCSWIWFIPVEESPCIFLFLIFVAFSSRAMDGNLNWEKSNCLCELLWCMEIPQVVGWFGYLCAGNIYEEKKLQGEERHCTYVNKCLYLGFSCSPSLSLWVRGKKLRLTFMVPSNQIGISL